MGGAWPRLLWLSQCLSHEPVGQRPGWLGTEADRCPRVGRPVHVSTKVHQFRGHCSGLVRMGHIYFPPVNIWKVTRPLPRPPVTGVPGVSPPGPWPTLHTVAQGRLAPLHACPSGRSTVCTVLRGDPERGHSTSLCFQVGPAHRTEPATNAARVFPSEPLVLGDSQEAVARGQRKKGSH